jgi:hypothetical protein
VALAELLVCGVVLELDGVALEDALLSGVVPVVLLDCALLPMLLELWLLRSLVELAEFGAVLLVAELLV